MIKFTDTEIYKENIISLWHDCFGDEEAYIRFFLENCPHNCVGYFVNDRLVSMLFLLDGKINDFTVKYIYAACTLPDYRCKGYMSELIEFSLNYCKKNSSDGVFLVPGESSLYDYYRRFGFVDVFVRKEYTLKNSGLKLNSFRELTDVKKIADIREKLISDIDAFSFDRKVTEYSVREHFLNNGKIYSDIAGDNKFLLFILKKENEIIIKELLAAEDVEMLNIFKHFLNNSKENIYIQSPIVYNSTDIMAKTAKCGMYVPLTDEIKHSSVGKIFYAGLYLD